MPFGSLFVINPADNSIDSNISVGSRPLNVFAYSGASSPKILVSHFASDDVYVLDKFDFSLTRQIAPIGDPYSAALCTSNGYIYLASRSENKVYLINPAIWDIVNSIALGGGCIGVAYVAAVDRIYVTNSSVGTVSVVNPSTNTVATTITVGGAPREIILSPYDGYLYISNRSLPYLSVVNPATNTVIGAINISAPSSGLCYCSPINSVIATSTDTGFIYFIPPNSFV